MRASDPLHDGRIVSNDVLNAGICRSGCSRTGQYVSEFGAHSGPRRVREALRMALRSLLHNRLRTALTMLGIVIGVASVVAMLAIGNAQRRKFWKDSGDGNRSSGYQARLAAVRGSSKGVVTLTPEDLPLLASLPGVAVAVPESDGTVVVRYGNKDLQVPAVGTSEHFRCQELAAPDRRVLYFR